MRHASHYAPRPLQQPQMPDMKQIKRSVCYHIRHFSLLSFPPRQFHRNPASLYKPTTQSPSFHQPIIRPYQLLTHRQPTYTNLRQSHRTGKALPRRLRCRTKHQLDLEINFSTMSFSCSKSFSVTTLAYCCKPSNARIAAP